MHVLHKASEDTAAAVHARPCPRRRHLNLCQPAIQSAHGPGHRGGCQRTYVRTGSATNNRTSSMLDRSSPGCLLDIQRLALRHVPPPSAPVRAIQFNRSIASTPSASERETSIYGPPGKSRQSSRSTTARTRRPAEMSSVASIRCHR
jgi:hypothetical protein